MKLPQLLDYKMALQTPSLAFVDEMLRRGNPRLDPLGMPASIAGGFAVTFDLKVDCHRYAIRCFYRQGNHLQHRYTAVADFIRASRLDFLVDVEYVHSGIRVAGDVFPIVRMPWVDGIRLDDWIDDHLYRPADLDRLRRNIAAAVGELHRYNAAHGDLQHGNILVRSDGSIRLVDYDGMYLPALRQYGAAEQGHRNYQHPERAGQYDPALDQFACHVIDVSLAALIHEPQLWRELDRNGGESLLFSAEDFANPAASPVFARLTRMTELTEQVHRLRRACEVGFDSVPLALAGHADPAMISLSSRKGAPTKAVIHAADRVLLLSHQGDEATVVGRIVAVKTIQRVGMITFLNFGEYRLGAFTVVAWDRGHRDLLKTFGDPANLNGSWISVTGVLSVFQRSGTTTPQIELRNARSIRTLTAAEAQALIALPGTSASRSRSAATTAAPPRQTPAHSTSTPSVHNAGQTVNASGGYAIDDQLSRFYSSPAFNTRLSGTSSTTPRTPSTAKPTKRTSPSTRPSTPIHPPAAPNPPPQPTSVPPLPPPRRRASQYVRAQLYQPSPPPTHTTPPHSPAPPPAGYAGDSGIAVAAVLAAVILGPVGMLLAVIMLKQGRAYSQTDRTCAWLALGIGAAWLLLCGCSILGNLLPSTGT